jgi:hypothetical protein
MQKLCGECAGLIPDGLVLGHEETCSQVGREVQ